MISIRLTKNMHVNPYGEFKRVANRPDSAGPWTVRGGRRHKNTGLDFNTSFNDKRLLQRTHWDLLHHKELLGLAALKANES